MGAENWVAISVTYVIVGNSPSLVWLKLTGARREKKDLDAKENIYDVILWTKCLREAIK